MVTIPGKETNPSYADEDDEERREAQLAHLQEVMARSSNTIDVPSEITGFEDEFTRSLIQAKEYLRKGGIATLRPLLPLLLQLKGKPYSLHNYFPFEPWFRTRVPNTSLHKTGRQVSKSTGLAAQGIVFSNSIPYFSTLYVTPLFEMIRRFSHNYVRQFLETSPAKNLFTGTKQMNSVLQRNFKNGSAMYFSYAFLDAERTRGVPADKVVIDECLREDSYVFVINDNSTIVRQKIVDIREGTVVLSFDTNRSCVLDVVRKVIPRGRRRCWTIRTKTGESLTLTSDTWLQTNKGWHRVSDIINMFSKADSSQSAEDRYDNTEATTVGDVIGRRIDGLSLFTSEIRQHSRRKTASVQHAQSPDIVTVRFETTRDQEEQRLRQNTEPILYARGSGLRLYRTNLLSARTEDSDTGVASTVELGGHRVLVSGRRLTSEGRICDDRDLLVYQARGNHVDQLAEQPTGYMSVAEYIRQATQSNLLRNLHRIRWDSKTPFSDHAIRSGMHAIQSYGSEAINRANMPILQRELQSFRYGARTETNYQRCTLLSERGVHQATSSSDRVSVERYASGSSQEIKPTFLSEADDGETATAFDLQYLRQCIRHNDETLRSEMVLPELSQGITTSSLSEVSLEETEIVSICFAGWQSVCDLETEKHNTFFAENLATHNCQNMNYDFLQIIFETLSGSPWGLKQFAGTPLSMDNTIQKLWEDSSQAEWVMRCLTPGCRHWNVPSINHDLYDMIGPWHRDISDATPGIVCAKCRKPLNPRLGRWVHAHPDRRWKFVGYHVPQIIMPMHYANQEKWDTLLGKQMGRGNTTPTTFLNEVCGESCDSGAKLITETHLKEAAILPWRRNAMEAKKHIKRYTRLILSVDWGGGGGRLSNSNKKKGNEQRLRTSFTTLSVLGMLPDGKIDIVWGHRSLRTHDFAYEARLCIEAIQLFKCSHIVHDYSGAGEGRLIFLYQSGMPTTNIINISYHGTGHNIMNFHEATDDNPHPYYSLDKSRSLVTTCECIKYGLIRSFQYDYESADNPGLLHDFLALIEEKADSRMGTDVYTIARNPNMSDDFAQSVNMGCCALWWMTKKWPNVAAAAKMLIPPEVLKHVHPTEKVDWNDV